MKGIVNRPLNLRQTPSVNANKLSHFDVGDKLEVAEQVLGDPFEDDPTWYRLTDGTYVWAGAVDLKPDLVEISEEDKNQWIISYRQNKQDGRPDLGAEEPAKQLFFTSIKLPAENENIKFTSTISHEAFVDGFMNSVRRVGSMRQHVFIYIHGYDPQFFATLKIELFNDFVRNYFSRPQRKLAKAIFFMWPGEGKGNREDVDDRSIRAGEKFTEENLFRVLPLLAKALNDEGRSLNLIVHSFGHQLLNGMLNPGTNKGNLPDKAIFKNVFLMAPDITHLAGQNSGGTLINYFKDKGSKDKFVYDYKALTTLAEKVHVFFDEYDFLLYASTKKFIGRKRLRDETDIRERRLLVENYRNLGNYGDIDKDKIANFNFFQVRELVNFINPVHSLKFPFRFQEQKHIDIMHNARYEAEYGPVSDGVIAFNKKQFKNYHRYLYTCEAVVDKVLSLL